MRTEIVHSNGTQLAVAEALGQTTSTSPQIPAQYLAAAERVAPSLVANADSQTSLTQELTGLMAGSVYAMRVMAQPAIKGFIDNQSTAVAAMLAALKEQTSEAIGERLMEWRAEASLFDAGQMTVEARYVLAVGAASVDEFAICLLYTSPSPRDS